MLIISDYFLCNSLNKKRLEVQEEVEEEEEEEKSYYSPSQYVIQL